MGKIFLHIQTDVYERIVDHLLSDNDDVEPAGFLFVRLKPGETATIFQDIEWFPVTPDGFLELSIYHFELAPRTRAQIIKRAHDLSASIVEFHSHRGPWSAEFSTTDMIGLEEFVPHVRWRLKGKPYFAIVLSQNGFDGLAWITNQTSPQYIDGIVTDGALHEPTRLSLLSYGVELNAE